MTNRARLLDLLRREAFHSGKYGLTSGTPAGWYLDVRAVATSSVGAHLIGTLLWEAVDAHRVEAVGAPATGGIALVTATALAGLNHGRPVEGFWVRDNPKPHGTQQLIEGALPFGARCAVVDDVTTTGSSLARAVGCAQHGGAVVVAAAVVLDRSDGTAAELMRVLGVRHYTSLFTSADFAAGVLNGHTG